MNTSFCNITDIPRYNGLQIKLNVMQVKPYQIYFGVICKESLKKCISKRNDLYRKHSVLPKGILLKKLTGPVKSKTSSSGYHGIYDHIYLEKTGDEIAVFDGTYCVGVGVLTEVLTGVTYYPLLLVVDLNSLISNSRAFLR